MAKHKKVETHSLLSSVIIVFFISLIAFYFGLYMGKHSNVDVDVFKHRRDYEQKMKLLAQI